MDCKICQKHYDDAKQFSWHLRIDHRINSEKYVIDHLFGGTRPTCKLCNNYTRYTSFSYKEYCKDHSKVAMSVAGTQGGKAAAWNKGKNKKSDIRLADLSKKLSGDGNPFFGKSHSQETIKRISESKTLSKEKFSDRLISRSSEFKLLTSLDDYFSRQKQYLEFECLSCNFIQLKTLQAFERGSKCDKCFPIGSSIWESEINDYIKAQGFDTLQNDRSVISPKEIDIYVPSKRFGIECHGLYWHSEASPKFINKNQHYEKCDLSKAVDVRLLQLFNDEWNYKKDVCKSLILNRLGCLKPTFGARECKVSIIDNKLERLFFDENHVSGYVQSKRCIALQKGNNIVAAISLRAPRQKKYEGYLEIARFSQKIYLNCPGSLGKLMKESLKYAKENGYKGIMTYVDRRIGDGHGYESVGMKRIGKTSVDYWYTDGQLRYDRFCYRAKDGKSERDVALEAGLSKIWGAGSFIYSIDV